MVSQEVKNLTQSQAAYETTTSAPLARQDSSAGYLFAYDYDTADASTYYKEEQGGTFLRKQKRQRALAKSWKNLIEANSNYHTPDFDTGEIDAIQNLTEKINSGELYPTEQIVEQLGERALALVALVDIELPACQVEKTILGIVVVNPKFEEKAVAAIGQIYHDNRPGVTEDTQYVARETVHKVAQVAANPDDYIDLDDISEPVPAVDRILEQGANMVTSPRINRIVQQKEWDAEDEEEAQQNVVYEQIPA